MGRRLARSWYRRGSLELAPDLLNTLIVVADGRAARVVEVEAYRGADDPASHAYRGRTSRNATMWGPPGHLYVYFTYGMHWCANVVCGEDGVAEAVLLRAAAPVAGVDAMWRARWGGTAGDGLAPGDGQALGPAQASGGAAGTRRGTRAERDLCRGPARLTQAMGIGAGHDGADLVTGGDGVWIASDGTAAPEAPAYGPRVGVSAGADVAWRVWIAGHPAVSAWRGSRRATGGVERPDRR